VIALFFQFNVKLHKLSSHEDSEKSQEIERRTKRTQKDPKKHQKTVKQTFLREKTRRVGVADKSKDWILESLWYRQFFLKFFIFK